MTPEFPKRVEIELSNRCNLRCEYCPRRFLKDSDGLMDFELFRSIITQILPHPDTVVVLHRRGESLLHPRFIDMLRLVKGNFKEVQIATNATALDSDKAAAIVDCLDFVSFSLDTPSRYEKVRGGDYHKVLKNIDYFLSINKGRVRTQASMVQTDEVTVSDIEEFKGIWKPKVDRVRIYQEHSSGGKFGSLKIKREKRLPCIMPSYQILIYFDGKVGRCNHDWESEPMGDLNKNTITEIWKSRKYKELRRQHRELVITDATCRECDSWYPEVGRQGTGEVVE